MAGPDLGVGNTHTAKKRGHHKLVSTIWMIIEKDLAAEIQRFFPIGSGKFIEKRSLKGFYAVNITVHACIKMLFFWNTFCQFRIKNNLVKYSKVRVKPKFFFRPCQHSSS